MAIEGRVIDEILSDPTVVETLTEFGKIGKWIQAIGLLVILWLVFQVINLIINLKRGSYLRKMRRDINALHEKVDKVIKRKKK